MQNVITNGYQISVQGRRSMLLRKEKDKLVLKELGAWSLNSGGVPQSNVWPEAWCDPASRVSTSTRHADEQWTVVASPWHQRSADLRTAAVAADGLDSAAADLAENT